MFKMFSLLFISGVLAVLAHGQVTCPSYKYYTVNTFKTDTVFSFSCYANGSDCTVLYAPPGTGCSDETLLEKVGSIPEDTMMTLETDFDIELGGGFCSDYQVSVLSPFGSQVLADINAYLPRATEAGKLFHLALFDNLKSGNMTCVASALSMSANVSVTFAEKEEFLMIDPYNFTTFNVGYPDAGLNQTILKINSDSPVIVSCQENTVIVDGARFVTLQKISSEPLLIDVAKDSYLLMVISNCSTNELITNISTVTVTQTAENGTACQSIPIVNETGYEFTQPCIVLVEPLDNVCVSVGLQSLDVYPDIPETAEDYPLISMGMPKSKLSSKFAGDSKIDSVNLLSFSNTTCTGYIGGVENDTYPLNWVGGELDEKVSQASWLNTFSTLSVLECANPVLVVPLEELYRAPFLAGHQSEDLWEMFFASENCSTDPDTPATPLTPATPATPATPNVTDVPTTSDARSLVTSWVVFFGFYIFASSLV